MDYCYTSMYFTVYHVTQQHIRCQPMRIRHQHPSLLLSGSVYAASLSRSCLHVRTRHQIAPCCSSSSASMSPTMKLAQLAPQPLFSLFEQVTQVPRPSFHEDRCVSTLVGNTPTSQHPVLAQGLGRRARAGMAPGCSTQPRHRQARLWRRRARPRGRPAEPRGHGD